MIPITKPSVTALEREYVNDALKTGMIGAGPYTEKFEAAWAKYNKYNYGTTCSSGTAALFLALKALGVGPGDEVIVPEFTMVCCAWAVTWCGATPVFIDCKDDLTMDEKKLPLHVNRHTKAIMAVAIYGRPVSDYVFRTAKLGHIPVVEDLAEGHGIKPRGDIVCYSFYGNKIITTGEGGMCLTNNAAYAEEMGKLRNLYFDKDRSMIHEKVGYNYRMSNMTAAFGLAQVKRIKDILKQRKQIISWYDFYVPKEMRMPKREVGWVYDIKCPDPVALKKKLWDHGIDSRFWFRPMSEQPMYKGWKIQNWNAHIQKGLYLPLYPGLKKAEVKKICDTLR